MTKLTDSQNVIISRSLARAARNDRHVVVSHKASGLSCDAKAYKAAINGLIKRKIIEVMAGLQRVEDGDYENSGSIYAITDAFLTEESPKETKKDKVAINIAVALTTPVQMPKKAQEKAIETPMANVGGLDESEEDPENGPNGSVVAEGYRAKYRELKAEGGTGQDCNDVVSQFMRQTFVSENRTNGRRERVVDVVSIMAFAAENGLHSERLPYVNNGQKRMIVGNMVRCMIRKGKDVVHNGRVILKGAKTEAKA